MHFLYPQTEDQVVDPAFAQEEAYWRAQGKSGLVCYDSLMRGDPVAVPQGKTVVYRGWPLTSDAYDVLFESVRQHGSTLVVSPPQYRLTTDILRWFPVVKDVFAPWLPRPVLDDDQPNPQNIKSLPEPSFRALITQENIHYPRSVPMSAKEFVRTVASRFHGVFFVLDVAQGENEQWYVTCVNNAQVVMLEEWPVAERVLCFPHPLALEHLVRQDLNQVQS